MAASEDRDAGLTPTSLDAITVALEDGLDHGLPVSLVICRTPDACCRMPKDGCDFCFRHDVKPGETPEEIQRMVSRNV